MYYPSLTSLIVFSLSRRAYTSWIEVWMTSGDFITSIPEQLEVIRLELIRLPSHKWLAGLAGFGINEPKMPFLRYVMRKKIIFGLKRS